MYKKFLINSIYRFTPPLKNLPDNNGKLAVKKENQPLYKQLFNKSMFIDEFNNIDIDFIKLAKKQSNLTFNKAYLDPKFNQSYTLLTPFFEIKRYDNFVNPTVCPHETLCNGFDYNSLLKNILKIYKNVLRKTLNPKKQYLCICSAGSDSRILCGLLAQLRDEEGVTLDNIIFHCWGNTEKDSFLQIMKRLRFSNISVLDVLFLILMMWAEAISL